MKFGIGFRETISWAAQTTCIPILLFFSNSSAKSIYKNATYSSTTRAKKLLLHCADFIREYLVPLPP